MGSEACPSARSVAKASTTETAPAAKASQKQAAPNAKATRINVRRGLYRSPSRLIASTKRALAPVPAEKRAETVVRERPVASMMESTKTEKTYDCPGPELNVTQNPTATITHP